MSVLSKAFPVSATLMSSNISIFIALVLKQLFQRFDDLTFIITMNCLNETTEQKEEQNLNAMFCLEDDKLQVICIFF